MFKPKKSYKNPIFINSDSARPIRILSEYIEPASKFQELGIEDTIVFFGSARTDEDNHDYKNARELARMLGELSLELSTTGKQLFHICTGGGPGIMEAANRGARDAGCSTIGLNISLPFEQYPNPYISEDLNFEFHYFFTRKLWLINHSRVVIVYPGGYGTLDELFETLTLIQTKKLNRNKMFILLADSKYWKEIINFESLVKYGNISKEDLDLFHFFDSPQEGFELVKEKLSYLFS